MKPAHTDATLRAIDLNLLRTLDVLLDTGSVSAASKRLGITPAATSNALRRLRDHYGDPLLVRHGAKLQRTPLAESLRPLCAEAMHAAARVLLPEVFSPATARGTVRLATSDHVDAVVVEPLRARLHDEAPALALLLEPYSAEAPRLVLEGRLDLVLAPRTQLPDAIQAARLFEEPYALVACGRHPTLRGKPQLDEVARAEHIVVAPTGRAGPTSFDRALAEQGLSRRIARRVPAFSQALLVVASTRLVCLMPRSFAELHAARLSLRVMPVPVSLPPVRIDLAWSPRVQHDPMHVWLRARIHEVARSAVPSEGERRTAASRARA